MTLDEFLSLDPKSLDLKGLQNLDLSNNYKVDENFEKWPQVLGTLAQQISLQELKLSSNLFGREGSNSNKYNALTSALSKLTSLKNCVNGKFKLAGFCLLPYG